MQPNLFGGEPATTVETSAAAAQSISAAMPALRERVYLAIVRAGAAGRTDEELQAELAMNPSTERPRRLELATGGLIRLAGSTRPTVSGRRAAVWVAVRG